MLGPSVEFRHVDPGGMKSKYYRQFNIWVREDDRCACCYRIFESIEDSHFAVQSADYFTLPIDKKMLLQSQIQMVELFIEQEILVREKFFPTINEAIKNFTTEL